MSTAHEQYTLLVVDDEPHILRSIGRLLRSEPVNLITAGGGQQALEHIRTGSVQVLLTDNRMPGMSGLELVRKVKEIAPEIIRVVISGQSDLEAVMAAINEGEVFRFLLKPWNDIDLKLTISLACAHYRLTLDNRALRDKVIKAGLIVEALQERYPEEVGEIIARIESSTHRTTHERLVEEGA